MKELQKVMGSTRRALDHYDMISDGDLVAVGLSGGKDSSALLFTLAKMRAFYPKKFDVIAITVDLGFDGFTEQTAAMQKFCDKLGVEYRVVKTQIAEIVFDKYAQKNPCSLCSKMRRGALVDEAVAAGANKIALGHHQSDVVETFMMKLMHEGNIGCFFPVTLYEDKGVSVIRPFVYTRECDIRSLVRVTELYRADSPCPMDKNTERESMKAYLKQFDREHKGLYDRVLTALENREIDGWF